MRRSIAILFSPLLLLAACNPDASKPIDDSAIMEDAASSMRMEQSDRSEDSMDPTSSHANDTMMEDHSARMEDTNTSMPAAVVPPPAVARVIEMTATDWEFSPTSITAKVGEKVVVRLTGVEGSHSFAIGDVNVAIAPGETKDIVLPTDVAGTFEFRCKIPCGPGHREMRGMLVIS